MIDDTRLAELLRSAMAPANADEPSADLWPRVARRARQPAGWSRFDLALAAAVAASLIAWPDMLILLAYHF